MRRRGPATHVATLWGEPYPRLYAEGMDGIACRSMAEAERVARLIRQGWEPYEALMESRRLRPRPGPRPRGGKHAKA